MSFRFKIGYLTFGALMVLWGCNIFNPYGTGDAGSTSGDVSVGEELFRRQDYAGAMAAFANAIREDSTNSMGYYGYAKAAIRYYKLNSNGILKDLDKMQKNHSDNFDSLPFLLHDDATLTARLQAGSRVNQLLGLLTDRDTLTRWFNYLKDSTSEARKDPLYAARTAFMRRYLDSADLGIPGFRPRSRFPLTDFVMPYDKIVVDLTAFKVLYSVTHLRDLDQNDVIDHHDDLLKLIHFGKDKGGFSVDNLGAIRGNLETDNESRENLNDLIQNVSLGLASSSQLAALIGGSSDTGNSLSGSSGNNVTQVIKDLGGAVTFYQFGDGRDNDGDGCVDEEIMDGKDNDNDGFVDEDARVQLPGMPDLIDNDHNGFKDLVDLREDPDTSTAMDTVIRTRTLPAHDSVFQASIPEHDSTYYINVFAHDSIFQASIPAHDSINRFIIPAHDSIYDSIAIPAHDTVPAVCFYDTTFQPPRCLKDTLHIPVRADSIVIHMPPQFCISDTNFQPPQCRMDTLHIPDHMDSGTVHIFPQFCLSDTVSHKPCRMDTVHIPERMVYDTVVSPGNPNLLGFVKDFQAQNHTPFVKILKGDSLMSLRIHIQKDSLATRSPSELTGSYRSGLDSAITYIGGCWPNYFPNPTTVAKRTVARKQR